jgi:hypothetical protein
LCADAAATGSAAAGVKKCMVANAADLSDVCRHELGRSLHMAFFVWREGGPVTAPCDADVKRLCLLAQPNLPATPGAVGACLGRAVGGAAGRGGRAGNGPGCDVA